MDQIFQELLQNQQKDHHKIQQMEQTISELKTIILQQQETIKQLTQNDNQSNKQLINATQFDQSAQDYHQKLNENLEQSIISHKATNLYIDGPSNLLFPVWFRFLDGQEGVCKIELSRNHTWNYEQNPLGQMSAMNQYAILLVISGLGCQSGGDVQLFNVEVFRERWAKGISHISYQMKCEEGYCKDYSGFYLRGGLSYILSSDKPIQFYYHNGKDIHKQTVIKQNGSQKWTVSQLDISELDPLTQYK